MAKMPIETSGDAKDPPGLTRRAALQGAGLLALTAAIGITTASPAQAAPGPWGGYSNGRIPLSALTQLSWSSGEYLRPDAASALASLTVQFRARFGVNISVTDAYRSYDQQVALKAQKPHLAAVPGTSNHGWGLAVDLGSSINGYQSAQHQWMRANAPATGWINPQWAWQGNGREEPWHWEYQGGPTTAPVPTPIPIPKEVFEMPVRIRHHSGGIYYVDVARGVFRALNPTDNSLLDRLGVPIVWDGLSDFERDQVRQLVRDYVGAGITG
ncbi:D-alanyl-D-alanine carboxypeptidase family protein [Oerskovia sp. KBS0722]|uniref:M15 family metallopeptidase n=1 Tax=Oerskovia sp. KBS0722 TaxID=1179673 RepID=UPI00110D45E1|nr:M15 family metallopeptidase [Oerskovia sp. KBS0722]QDW64258.1 hypothetical protein FFI11_018665 [Oerskovia sp. KBS0722]